MSEKKLTGKKANILKETAPLEKPQQPLPKKHFTEHYNLPVSYNATSIRLVARDPHWVYAYWEIVQQSIQDVKNQLGDDISRSSYIIRMYDVTYINFNGQNANRWFDIDVGPNANNWYINLWNDNASYCADLGIRAPDGRFFALARSNFVTTPRSGSSHRSEAIWMDVKENNNTQAPRPYVFLNPQNHKKNNNPSSNPAGRIRRRIFLTEDDIRLYYSRLFPLLGKVLATRLKRREGRFNIYLDDNGLILDKILFSKGRMRRLMAGASEELVAFEGASDVSREKPGASERIKQKETFFFELGTELIVYGRTEPDAEVWLYGKKINLRPDGTFTLRFALPDGKIPLRLTAENKNKTQKRKITTSVERQKTSYNV